MKPYSKWFYGVYIVIGIGVVVVLSLLLAMRDMIWRKK